MCQPLSQGGKRCAAHVRPKYEAATFGTPEWDDLAAQYAMTQEGRAHHLSAVQAATFAEDWDRVAAHTSAFQRGDQCMAASAAFKATRDKERADAAAKKAALRKAERSSDHDELRRILRSTTSETMRVALARNPHSPDDVLRALASNRMDGVRREVAARPSLPDDVYETLMNDRNADVRFHLYRFCDSTPDVAVRAWAVAEDENVRDRAAASADGTTADVLATLASDSSEWVRGSVARNQHTSGEVLRRLSTDEKVSVAHAAMWHPNLTHTDLVAAVNARAGDLYGHLHDGELADLQAHLESRGIQGALTDPA